VSVPCLPRGYGPCHRQCHDRGARLSTRHPLETGRLGASSLSLPDRDTCRRSRDGRPRTVRGRRTQDDRGCGTALAGRRRRTDTAAAAGRARASLRRHGRHHCPAPCSLPGGGSWRAAAACRAGCDLPPGEPAEVARNARRPGARGVVGRLQPDVAAAPAAPPQPPPGAPHRAGTRVQVQIGTMPAAPARHGRRPADIGTRRRRHAGLRPATGHGNLLVLAGAVPCTSKKEPRFCRCTTAGTARSQLPGSGATLSHYASAAHPHRPYTHRRPGDPWSCRRRARRTTAADEPYARGEQCEPRVLALRLS
jgi:hypothetical protein